MQKVGQNTQFWQGAPVAPALKSSAKSSPLTKNTKRRHERFRPRLRTTCVVSAALGGALLYTIMTEGGRHTPNSAPILPAVETAAAAAGFGLDQVSLTGHKFTPASDIFKALDLENARSVVSLDAEAAQKRIENLPWIKEAHIERVYPGGLTIKVTERQPWAVWRRGKRNYLIDDTGRVLAAVKPGTAAGGLLRLTGEGAAKEAAGLMTILARYPRVGRDLQEAHRIAGRRWNLKLSRNMMLILPPEREAQALTLYTSDAAVKRLTAKGGYAVDLRAVNKITLRDISASAPSRAKSG